MDDATQDTAAEQATTAEIIREVCHQCRDEPGAIWDALEAKGIETTPGVIHQAFNTLDQPATADLAPEPSAEVSPGLTAEDMAALGILAVKAGGVDQLIRILSVWQESVSEKEAYAG